MMGAIMEQQKYHEINRYRDADFPVEVYRGNEAGMFPKGRGLCDFHWHDELQFTLAVRGSLDVQVNEKQYHLETGEALFINSGMIHAVTRLSGEGEYTSLNFPYKLLSFFPGSRMEKSFVLPYVTSGCLPVVILSPHTKWQGELLELLREINEIWYGPAVLKSQYLIAVKLVTLWHALLSNMPGENKNTMRIDVVRQQRLQQMLSFIYEHFSEDVSLGDIADAAHISAGECCRIFREHLQTTPYRFLTEYRIRKSAELLCTERSVSEVAKLCGYSQVSNYIAKFKTVFDCTPAKYRRNGKEKTT